MKARHIIRYGVLLSARFAASAQSVAWLPVPEVEPGAQRLTVRIADSAGQVGEKEIRL